MDLAELGIRIDSASAVSGVSNLDRLTDAASRAEVATEKLATTSTGAARGFSLAGNNGRMLAMQLSQVGQMGAATGNYMQALAIQGADIGALFGVAGAVIGTVAGVALPMLISAMSSGTEQVSAMQSAMDALNSSADDASLKLSQVRFGLYSTEEVALIREVGRLVAEQTALRDQAVQEEGIVAQYLIDQADAMNGQVAAARAALANYQKITAELEAAQVEQDLLTDGLTKAGLEALKLAGVDIASGISAARIEAANLAAELGIALSQAVSIMNMRGSKEYSGRGGDPRDFMEGGAKSYNSGAHPFVYTPAAPGSGGGGGGGGGIDPYQADLEALVASLEAKTETVQSWYEESRAMLADHRAQEILGTQQHQEAMIALEAEYQSRMSEIQGQAQQQRISDVGGFFGALAGVASAGGQRMVKIVAAFEAAQGIMNAYGAYLRALNSPVPMTPWGRAAAALNVLGAGLRGVMAIKQAGGIGGSVGSTGGGAIAAQGATTQAPQGSMLTIAGINRNDLLTGEMLEGIIDGIAKIGPIRGVRLIGAA